MGKLGLVAVILRTSSRDGKPIRTSLHTLLMGFEFAPGYYGEEEGLAGSFASALLRRARMTAPQRFDEYLRCYPVVMLPGPERENVNHGGKVIMPPSALDKLTRLHITYPMLFEVINGRQNKLTHAGVLEFIAEEGKIYLPFWVRIIPISHRTY